MSPRKTVPTQNVLADDTTVICPRCEHSFPLPELVKHTVGVHLRERDARIQNLEGQLDSERTKATQAAALKVHEALAEAQSQFQRQMEERDQQHQKLLGAVEAKLVTARKESERLLQQKEQEGAQTVASLKKALRTAEGSVTRIQAELAGANTRLQETDLSVQTAREQGRQEGLHLGGQHLKALQKQMDVLLKERTERDQEWRSQMDAAVRKARTQGAEQEATRQEQARQAAVDAEVAKLRRKLSSEHSVALQERETQIQDLRKKVEDLNRRMEPQTSELKGRAAEDVLREELEKAFIREGDAVVQAKKGQRSADFCLQVQAAGGASLLVESKFTQSWSEAWVDRALEDADTMCAYTAVIVTRTLPPGVAGVTQTKGVWIVPYDLAIPVIRVLRQGLIEVQQARRAARLSDDQHQQLLAYLSSPAFSRRVDQIVAQVQELRDRLDKERTQHETAWTIEREAHTRILTQTLGIFNDLNLKSGAVLEPSELIAPYLDAESTPKPRRRRVA